MLNAKKIETMTRVAMYERTSVYNQLRPADDGDMQTARFGNLKDVASAVIVYLGLVSLCIITEAEGLFKIGQYIGPVFLVLALVIAGAVFTGLYLLVAHEIRKKRFEKTKNMSRRYSLDLRRLEKIFDSEEQTAPAAGADSYEVSDNIQK